MMVQQSPAEEEAEERSTLANSAVWAASPYDSVWNPASHSWIIVPADVDEQSASAASVATQSNDACVDEQQLTLHAENRLLAAIGALALPCVPAPTPAPSSPIPHREERKTATANEDDDGNGSADSPTAVSELQLPDGVQAWTQASHFDLQTMAPPALAQSVSSLAGDKSLAPSDDAAHAPARPLGWDAGRGFPPDYREPLRPPPLAGLGSFRWSDPHFKWLVVTNAATLLVGVVLGNALAQETHSSANCACTSSRQVTARVA